MKAIFYDLKNKSGFEFEEKIEDLIAFTEEELFDILKKIETYTTQGLYVVGFISYEAGYYFLDKKIEHKKLKHIPLLHFEIFKKIKNSFNIPNTEDALIYDIKYSENKEKYNKKFSIIKDHLKNGNTYQTNYTFRMDFKSTSNPENLFYKLSKEQDAEFGSFLDFQGYSILSLSPELFIKKKGDVLFSKPMKGTAKVEFENKKIIEKMKSDQKIISENSIVVDLIRNDMSIIAEKGTVEVKNPFEIQTFKTVNQMITTVECRVKNKSFFEIIKALFPCGSITGAPKIKTMEIIEENEEEPRGIYCGAIGYILPNNDFCFNVAIRTVVFNKKDKKYTMGIGGGITYDSSSKGEFEECLVKSQFLKNINDFEIFETMKSKGGVIQNFDLHIQRLKNSCEFFGFNFSEPILPKIPNEESRFKISIRKNGEYNFKISEIEKISTNKIKISNIRTNSGNIFLYHKTTIRDLYNNEYQKYLKENYYDIIFMNENNFITEGSRNNIFIKKGRKWFTPPIESGVLPGITRKLFIEKNKVIEKNLKEEDIFKADEIWLSNSVRGLIKVIL